MSILELITEISFCLVAAAILGFAVGWLFSVLFKNEKMGKKYTALQEEFEIKQSDIHHLEEELYEKNSAYQELELKLNECEKEKLSNEMDQEDCDRYIKQIKELQSENNILISQIKEQKLCEDENEILETEIKALESEKQSLLDKLDDYTEYKHNYKALIMEIEALKSEKGKLEKQTTDTIKTPLKEHKEENILSKKAYNTIMRDIITLKDEAQKIKSEKITLEDKLSITQKQLSQTKLALQECHKSNVQKNRILPPDTDTTLPAKKKKKKSLDHLDKEVCQDTDMITSQSNEFKTLSELIKDALKDIKDQ